MEKGNPKARRGYAEPSQEDTRHRRAMRGPNCPMLMDVSRAKPLVSTFKALRREFQKCW